MKEGTTVSRGENDGSDEAYCDVGEKLSYFARILERMIEQGTNPFRRYIMVEKHG